MDGPGVSTFLKGAAGQSNNIIPASTKAADYQSQHDA